MEYIVTMTVASVFRRTDADDPQQAAEDARASLLALLSTDPWAVGKIEVTDVQVRGEG